MEVMTKLAEMDWLGIPYPAEYGGAGADYHGLRPGSRRDLPLLSSNRFTLSATTGLVMNPFISLVPKNRKAVYYSDR